MRFPHFRPPSRISRNPPAARLSFAAAWALSFCLLMAACQSPRVPEPAPPPQASEPGPVLVPALPRVGLPLPAPAPTPTLTPPPGIGDHVAVGLLLPLSGPRAAFGQSMLRAAQLALFEVADKKFMLLPRDTGGTAEGAQRAAEAAIAAGAQLLLGPVFMDAVKGASPVARTAGINMIAFTNDRDLAGNGVYVLGVSPLDKIDRVVRYAVTQGRRRFAALIPNSPYGDLLQSGFAASIARAGGTLARVQRYGPSAESMTEAVQLLGNFGGRRDALQAQRRQLMNQGDAVARLALKRLEGRGALGDVDFDAVLVPETGEAVKALAPLLPYYEIDTRRVRILGIDDWSARALRREPTLNRAWYAAPSPDALKGFQDRLRGVFEREPKPLDALAYDAVALAAVLASGQGGPMFDSAALAGRNGFAGSTGLFRLLPSGTTERRFAVLQVAPDAVKVIAPAPKTFDELTN